MKSPEKEQNTLEQELAIKYNANNMLGLFSCVYFRQGDVIAEITGENHTEPTRQTIQTGYHEHIKPDNNLRYLNHCCTPNARVAGRTLIATKEIKISEEITFNYNATEDKLADPFVCVCCGNLIQGRSFVQMDGSTGGLMAPDAGKSEE